MRFVSVAVALAGLALASVSQVEAKGCIKGAILGGIAGQVAGHGVLGAAAGCAAGRYQANRQRHRLDNQVRQPNRIDNSRL